MPDRIADTLPVKIILLALGRISELGQKAFSAHQDLERWRPVLIDSAERSKLSFNLQYAVEEQQNWIAALEEIIEKQGD